MSRQTWTGTLGGYRVDVFYLRDGWCYAIIHPQGWTPICANAGSFTDAARKARAWVERQAVK